VSDEGKFVGFVSCDRDWWEDNRFFLREIFVSPDYQGQGVGRYLMQRCIDHARAHGAVELVTQTAYENIPMQQLCEKSGFVRWNNPQWTEGITYKLGV
jgi:GNAT superfamily N-acetyltransferase